LAIFGVRGGTGVIAITTKRAKAGQTNINYNGIYGIKNLVDKIEMASASQFDELFDEENANNGIPTPDYSAVKNKNNTDWIDAVTRKGKFQTHNISMSGTSDKNKFNFGLGYISDEGIVIREKLKKYLISFSDEYKINSAIKVGINFNASRQENPYDATWVLDAARKVMPHISPDPTTMRVRDLYGTIYDSINVPVYSGLVTALQSSGVINPVLQVENEWDKTISRENRYVGSFFTDVSFLKNFNVRATWYADVSDVNRRKYNPMYYAYNPIDGAPYLYTNNATSVEQNDDKYRKFQQDYILTYRKKFGDHSVTATGGFTTFYYNAVRNYAKSTGGGVVALPIPNDPDKWYISNNFGRVLEGDASGSATEYTTVSLLGRFLYNYRGKYFLNASIRDDASSRIPEKNRHQQFWAVGAAWEISRESFMESVGFIDFLKLKASTGVLGNQSTYHPSLATLDYPFYPGIITGSEANFGTIGYVAALPAYQKNPDLKWETVNSYEIGLEMNALNNRLHFEYNFYDKRTKDMMTYIGLGSLGYDDIIKNGGEVRNWGHEVSASWNQKLTNDLTLTVNGNITFMDNKVISVAEDLPGGRIIDARANNGSAEARTFPGYPIGSFFGYVVEGLYQTDLDRLVSPFAGSVGTYLNGDFKFRDVNGDGVISDLDRTVIGNPSPDFIYGGSVNLQYKRFNLSVDIGGVYGNEVFRVWGALESPFQRVNYPALKYDRWHGAGTSNWEPIISQQRRFNYNGSTYNIEDGSYIRIRNLQLGYDVASRILTKARIKSLRLFVNVQNLKTWKNNNGYTAEFGGRATAFGFDEAGGAIPRVTTFGLNLNF
jgi:TonB-linked SusC/RagA family outer membrane protein